MATVKEINHDSSLVIGDFYSTVTDPDGAISVTAASALGGSTNGVDCDFDAGNSIPNLIETFAFATNDFRWRVRVKLDNLSSVGTATPADFFLEDNANGTEFKISITSTVGVNSYEISLLYNPDIGGLISIGTVSFPSTGDICIEVRAIRETGASAADGEIELFVNGISKMSVSNAENFTQFAQIAQTRIRFGSDNANLSGNMFYDQWLLDDDDTADLGCTADLLTLSTIPKPASIDASGTFIYLALLNNGTPILSKISTALDADGTTVFDPGAGDAVGVECGRFNANIVWIVGAFDGTNVVEKSEDAGSSFLIKDNATIGDIRAFVLGPDSDERLLIFDETNGDILETNDDGAIWNSINAAVTPEVNAIARLGENVQESVFGNDGAANDNVNYSVNSGADLEDFNLPVNENVTGVIVN